MSKEIWKPGTMLYPVPAVMVSCQDKNGNSNIITIAWTGTICSDPAMLYISVRPDRYSYDMIKSTGEFIINIPNTKLVSATDFCGVKSGRDFNKFEYLNLTPIMGSKINVPYIDEAPINIECRVKQIIELGSHHMFLAEVLAVNVDKELLDSKNALHLEKANLITYSHGKYYSLDENLGFFGYSIQKKKNIKRK